MVIPCFNGAAYLREAIDSALSQDFSGAVEIIVGNDGSTDASREIARSYPSQVVVVEHPGGRNRGLPATRNLCLRQARHEYVAFLDADDAWLPSHLSDMVNALELDGMLGLAVDNGLTVTEGGEVWGDRRPNVAPGPLRPEDVLLNQWFPPCAVVARARVIAEVGGFEETLGSAEDQDMWLRVLEVHRGVYVDAIGYRYRVHSGQMSANPVPVGLGAYRLEPRPRKVSVRQACGAKAAGHYCLSARVRRPCRLEVFRRCVAFRKRRLAGPWSGNRGGGAARVGKIGIARASWYCIGRS